MKAKRRKIEVKKERKNQRDKAVEGDWLRKIYSKETKKTKKEAQMGKTVYSREPAVQAKGN